MLLKLKLQEHYIKNLIDFKLQVIESFWNVNVYLQIDLLTYFFMITVIYAYYIFAFLVTKNSSTNEITEAHR